MPDDPEEYYCVQCDRTYEVKIIDELGDEPLEVAHCPYCGEALEPDEL